VANGYSWSASRNLSGYRLPSSEHLGWWAALAMVVSILLHVVVFFALDRMKIAVKFEKARELTTRPIDVRQIEVRPPELDRSPPPEEVVQPPKDTAALLEDVELLNALPKDQEIDIKPKVVQAEYALRMQAPVLAGSPDAVAQTATSGFDIDSDLPKLGREPTSIKPAEVGQITVDPGAVQGDDSQMGKFAEDLIKRGANGNSENGKLDGMASLDAMLDLPSNVLLSKKTMLPSDLLFEFNRAELRESAKIGLMKLGLLMDHNPGLYCWIEGHSDLVGGDEFNLNLSIKRAEAVRDYLVNSLRMDASKIFTRGFGRYEPIVTTGTSEQQSANRRVEIRMRQTPPTKDQLRIEPKKAAVVEETPPPVIEPKKAVVIEETPPPKIEPKQLAIVEGAPAPKAVLVKPKRALPVEEVVPPLKATPIEEAPPAPRATPVEPEAPRALPLGD
jgi:outer membrane protein OmpA-like peptidoglycan-associated protein